MCCCYFFFLNLYLHPLSILLPLFLTKISQLTCKTTTLSSSNQFIYQSKQQTKKNPHCTNNQDNARLKFPYKVIWLFPCFKIQDKLDPLWWPHLSPRILIKPNLNRPYMKMLPYTFQRFGSLVSEKNF